MKKIFNPKRNLVLFILFVISIIVISNFREYMYAHKFINILIVVFYFFPGILFFAFSSIYNIRKCKNAEIKTKVIILFPLLIIVLYILYILLMLGYAMIYR